MKTIDLGYEKKESFIKGDMCVVAWVYPMNTEPFKLVGNRTRVKVFLKVFGEPALVFQSVRHNIQRKSRRDGQICRTILQGQIGKSVFFCGRGCTKIEVQSLTIPKKYVYPYPSTYKLPDIKEAGSNKKWRITIGGKSFFYRRLPKAFPTEVKNWLTTSSKYGNCGLANQIKADWLRFFENGRG